MAHDNRRRSNRRTGRHSKPAEVGMASDSSVARQVASRFVAPLVVVLALGLLIGWLVWRNWHGGQGSLAAQGSRAAQGSNPTQTDREPTADQTRHLSDASETGRGAPHDTQAPVPASPAPQQPTRPASAPETNIAMSDVKIRFAERESQAGILAAKVDVARDDWASEAATEAIQRQLDRLSHLMEQVWHGGSSTPTAESWNAIFAHDFTGDPWRPQQLQMQQLPDGTVVRTALTPESQSVERPAANSLAHRVEQLFQAVPRSAEAHVKFKLIHIDLVDQAIETTLRCELFARGPDGSLQQTSQWRCRWIQEPHSAGAQQHLLASINVGPFEEVEYRGQGGTLYSDCTESVLGRNRSYAEQVLPGIPEWSKRLSREFMSQFGHHGVAVGDGNGDGLEDLYVCDTGGLPNRLYLQKADGTAIDVSQSSGVDLLNESTAALFVDLDNDGDQDLVVAASPFIQFAENDGAGRFTLHPGTYVETDAYSLSAIDVNGDRLLDVYVCGYNSRKPDPTRSELPFPLPYNDANNGGRNYLLLNDGAFQFHDATGELGLDQNNTRFSLGSAWEDFDNDGDLDLYVANDFGRNCLYRNDGGRFADVAAKAGVEDQASGMSVSWGDYDRDGWMDIYVSNMFSAAGNRITYQRKFADGLSHDTVSGLQRMARGNTLFRNKGNGTFEDVSEVAQVTMGRWAWASRFADINNDGWEDLLVANGYATNDDTGDL